MRTLFIIELSDRAVARRYPTVVALDERRFVISQHTLQLLEKEQVHFQLSEQIDASKIEDHVIYPVKSFLYSTPEEGALDEIIVRLFARKQGDAFPYAIFLGRNANLEEGAFFLDRPGGRRRYQWKILEEKPDERSMEETFPRFLECVRDEETKFVVSFGSGGLRLFAQPSMMKFINDIKARRYIDEIWGCSGGALSGLCYSMDVDPRAIEQKGYDIYNQRFRLRLSPSFFLVLKNIIFDTFLPTPPTVLKGYLSVHKAMSLALYDLIAKKQFEVPFFCVAYNVRKDRNDILTPMRFDHDHYRDIVVTTEPIDAVAASSSIPIIYVPKEIRRGAENEAYIDGSMAEPVPLLSVYRKWMIDKECGMEKRKKLFILAIDPLPGIGLSAWLAHRWLRKLPYVDLAHFGLTYFELIMQARISNQMEILRQDPHVELFMVRLPLSTKSILNIKKIPRIIHDAQSVLLDQMIKIEQHLGQENEHSWR